MRDGNYSVAADKYINVSTDRRSFATLRFPWRNFNRRIAFWTRRNDEISAATGIIVGILA